MSSLTPSSSSNPSDLPRLSVTPLTEADTLAEFTLACLWRPELEQGQWQAFLRDWYRDAAQRGILSARNQRGGVLGFAPWWRQPDLEYGEILWAGPLIVREMGVRPLVRDALIGGLEEMSETLKVKLRLAESH